MYDSRAQFMLMNPDQMMPRDLNYDEKWEALVLGLVNAGKTDLVHLVGRATHCPDFCTHTEAAVECRQDSGQGINIIARPFVLLISFHSALQTRQLIGDISPEGPSH